MAEFSQAEAAAEIAEISREVEKRRAALESERGIKEERAVVHEVISEKIFGKPAKTEKETERKGHYLDNLSDEEVEKLNGYISSIHHKGLKKTVALARKENPFLLDAFHDCLTDKLYEELKNHGLVS